MDRRIKEAIYIRTEEDNSMNVGDKACYQLSRVYDKLFTAAATFSGKRKLNVSFQQKFLQFSSCFSMTFYTLIVCFNLSLFKDVRETDW